MRYAIIENNKVVNVVVSDSLLSENWIESRDANPGDEYVDGQFVRPPEDFSELAKIARAQRNAMLSKSDWTQLADAPVDDLSWATYRQALRDVPGQVGFPWEIQWPTPPGGA